MAFAAPPPYKIGGQNTPYKIGLNNAELLQLTVYAEN